MTQGQAKMFDGSLDALNDFTKALEYKHDISGTDQDLLLISIHFQMILLNKHQDNMDKVLESLHLIKEIAYNSKLNLDHILISTLRQLALIYCDKNKFLSAMAYSEEYFNLRKKLNLEDDKEKIGAGLTYSTSLLNAGDYERAKEEANIALKACFSLQNCHLEEIQCYILLSYLSLEKEAWLEFSDTILILRNLIENTKLSHHEEIIGKVVEILCKAAKKLAGQHETSKSLHFCTIAFQIASQYSYSEIEFFAVNQLTGIYFDLTKYDKALALWEKFETKNKKINSVLKVVCIFKSGDYRKALEESIQILPLIYQQKPQNDFELLQLHYIISFSSRCLENYKKSLDSTEIILQLAKDMGSENPSVLAIGLLFKALNYFSLNLDKNQALNIFQIAINTWLNMFNENDRVQFHHILQFFEDEIRILIIKNDFKPAENLLNNIVKATNSSSRQHIVTREVLFLFYQIYEAQGLLEKCIESLQKLFDVLTSNNFQDDLSIQDMLKYYFKFPIEKPIVVLKSKRDNTFLQKYQLLSLLLKVSLCYFNQNNISKSEEILKMIVLILAQENKEEFVEFTKYVHFVRGVVAFCIKDYLAAQESWVKATELKLSSMDNLSLAIINYWISEACIKDLQIGNSTTYLNESRRLSKEIKDCPAENLHILIFLESKFL